MFICFVMVILILKKHYNDNMITKSTECAKKCLKNLSIILRALNIIQKKIRFVLNIYI